MTDQIDHFVWATPNLEQGCAEIERLFGVTPERGGAHPGLGTRNALLSLGANIYLEIMAPTQDTPPKGSVGDRLARLDEPGLATWVLRSNDLNALAASATAETIDTTPLGPVPTERLTPQGERLVWELLFYTRHTFGGLVPFMIDWKGSPHPSFDAPIGGSRKRFAVCSTKSNRLNALYSDLGIETKADADETDSLQVHLETPRGRVELHSTPQTLSVLDM
ncbi:MAG: VOC family protein [Henriciella sp.]